MRLFAPKDDKNGHQMRVSLLFDGVAVAHGDGMRGA